MQIDNDFLLDLSCFVDINLDDATLNENVLLNYLMDALGPQDTFWGDIECENYGYVSPTALADNNLSYQINRNLSVQRSCPLPLGIISLIISDN